MSDDAFLLTDQAYNSVKRAIITHELLPSAKISEAQLARLFGCGMASVRAAVRRLAGEGFIIAAPRCKHRVAALTLAEIQNTFDLRNLLEPEAARQAAGQLDRDELLRLNDLCQQGYVPGDTESEYQFLQANSAFHNAIANGAANPRLAAWIKQLQDSAMRILMLVLRVEGQADRWSHGHDEIIDALTRGDGERAKEIALTHLLDGQRRVFDVLLSGKGRLKFSIEPIVSDKASVA